MVFYHQLKGMIKAELIQMKRNIFLSFIEFFSPIILLLFFYIIRLLFSLKKEDFYSLYGSDAEYIFTHSSNLTHNISKNYKLEDIKINETSSLPYYYFLKQCNKTKYIATIGKNFPQEIKSIIMTHFWEFENGPNINPNNIFKNFDSIEKFNSYISSENYGVDKNSPEICFGISKTDEFQFGIHYKSISLNQQNTNEIENLISQETPHVPDTKSDKSEQLRIQENPEFFEKYLKSGYLMTLKTIYDYFLKKITGSPNAEINFSVIGMKFDEISKDNFHKFLSLLGFFVIICYTIPMSINIYKQIYIKETLKKNYLKTMGVPELIFFITYFIRSFFINIFHAIFTSLLINSILKQAQYIYLFVMLFLFGLVIISMTTFFQSFLKVSRLGVIISLLIYCIMSFFYIPLKSLEVPKSLRYFICVIFPPTNILLGFNTFYAFERQFSPLDNRTDLDVAEISINLTIVFLLVSFFLYLFLGFIVSKICNREFTGKNNSNNKNVTNYSNIYTTSEKSSELSNSNNTEISSERSKSKAIREKSDFNDDSKNNKKYKKSKKKTGNPPPKGTSSIHLSVIGENYLEEDEEEDNVEELNNDIKVQYYDYIQSKAKDKPKEVQKKKLDNLKKSIWLKKQNNIEQNMKDDPFMLSEIDEIELDLENQVEAQKIRDNRRINKSTMFDLRPEGENIDQNLRFSNIEYIIEDPVVDSTEDYINIIGSGNGKVNDNENNINNDNKNGNINSNSNGADGTSKFDYSEENKNEKNRKNDTKTIESKLIDTNIENDKSYKTEQKKSKKNKKKAKEIDPLYSKKKKEEYHAGSKIIIKNLKKVYEDNGKKVLNNISFELYQDEIFALLGRNGEGKSTFISILSGLIEATEGSILYQKEEYGKKIEILSPEGMKLMRSIIGVCSQNNNIIYNDLTVKENLEIFYLFKFKKYNYYNDINYEVENLLKIFKLEEKANTKAGKLSGGEKRKLVIAIAYCGGSEIIVLDEPTGGIDITSKKEIWDILREQKKNKIIVLITHYMDEVWELSEADMIGFLKDGKISCFENRQQIMEDYMNFINIKLSLKKNQSIKELVGKIEKNFLLKKNNKEKKEKFITNIISTEISNESNLIENTESFTSNSTVNFEKIEYKEYKERAIIKIPSNNLNYNKINELFDLLQEKCNNYLIEKENKDAFFINFVKEKKRNDKKKFLLFSDENNYYNNYTSFSKFKNELKEMSFKRFLETIRDKKSLILEILFPILLTLIGCLLCHFEILEDNKPVSLDLNNMDLSTQSIFCTSANDSNFEDITKVLSSDAKKEEKKYQNFKFHYFNVSLDENESYLNNLVSLYQIVYNVSKELGITNNTGSFYFKRADKESHQYEFTFYVSSKKKHSTIFFTNYLLRYISRYEMKRSYDFKSYMDNIQITNYPFPLTYKEKQDKKSREGFNLVFFISIALSLIPANFITIILREKQNKSKHLQLLSGASIYTYWINNYIFELVKYYVVVGFCIIILFIFSFYEKYLAVLYLFYGPALVSFTYVINYFINREGTGQIVVLLINLFFGSLCSSAVLILRTNSNFKTLGIVLSYFFRIIPSFCICYGYNELISKKILFAIDYFNIDEISDFENIKKKYNDESYILTDPIYISSDIIFLSLAILIYTFFLIFLENKDYFLWKLGCYNAQLYNDSLDSSYSSVQHEKKLGGTSKEEISKNKSNENLFQVKKLSKSYYKKKGDEDYNGNSNCFLDFFKFIFCLKGRKEKVLNDLSFKVSNGECFCLLGKNGAGKSTSFRCFCKEEKPDKGSIEINGINISDFTKKQPIIGYCPQFDCVFEYLTPRENLNFYAGLKGIKEESLSLIVDTLLDKLDLTEYENMLTQKLSGGNKRKLSVGISLLCRPSIIFMDEPSTGMDPYSRQLLLDLLHNAYLNVGKKNKNKNKRAMILITHLINEADVLSDTVGILNNHKIEKKGKIYDLIQKESKEILLSIQFNKPKAKYLKNKYGDILIEKLTNKKEINNFLISINKTKYTEYITKENFGKDIYNGLKKRKYVKKNSILKLVEYLDNILGITSELKKYFSSVICINFSLNQFVFKVIRKENSDICDSRIFGIIEGCKDKYNIFEYNYTLTDLESIFLNQIKEDKDKNNKDKDENNKDNSNINEKTKINVSL